VRRRNSNRRPTAPATSIGRTTPIPRAGCGACGDRGSSPASPTSSSRPESAIRKRSSWPCGWTRRSAAGPCRDRDWWLVFLPWRSGYGSLVGQHSGTAAMGVLGWTDFLDRIVPSWIRRRSNPRMRRSSSGYTVLRARPSCRLAHSGNSGDDAWSAEFRSRERRMRRVLQ
jgi:hypothetical protein